MIADFNARQIIKGVITASAHLMIVLKFQLPAQTVGIFRKDRANIKEVIAGRLVKVGISSFSKPFQLADSPQILLDSSEEFRENFRRIKSAQKGSRGDFPFLNNSAHYSRFH